MNELASAPRFESVAFPGGLRLKVNSNRKLKTLLVKAFLAADLDATVTRRALLPLVLRRGTRTLPDMQALNRHLEDLYGAGLGSSVVKIGEWHVTRFALEVVNDRFLPAVESGPGERAGLFAEGLRFLRDLLFDPCLVARRFRDDCVGQEKENLRRAIESLLDEKGAYATFRCVEEMCAGEEYRRGEQGCVEDLAEVEPAGLSADWRSWYGACPLSIYVAGDIEPRRARDQVAEVFSEPRPEPSVLAPPPSPVPVGPPREVIEHMEVQQAKLVLGFRHGVTYRDPRYEALVLMNGILGGYSHSKLFQNVREKASLAYSAYSWPERTKGLLFISCGIAAENYEKAVEISQRQVRAMARGEFTDHEYEATLRTLLDQNRMLEDNFSALIDVDFVRTLHGRQLDLEEFRRRLRAVRREQIVEVASLLEHDMTYLLRD